MNFNQLLQVEHVKINTSTGHRSPVTGAPVILVQVDHIEDLYDKMIVSCLIINK